MDDLNVTIQVRTKFMISRRWWDIDHDLP